MDNIMKPQVAGMFYPADANELNKMLAKFFVAAEKFVDFPIPKAIIAPHAGYIYSGPIAASAYACLKNAQNKIKRIVIFAPAHRYGFYGLATLSAKVYATPLGNINIDQNYVTKALELPNVATIDAAFNTEHALEVHLPFLQTILKNDFLLVPLLVSEANQDEVANVLNALWDDSETLIIVSSDLSHYYDYQTAKKLDAATAKIIESLDSSKIEGENACGYKIIKGLLPVAKAKKMQVKVLDLRNSGDTAGDKDQVVGYGGFHFTE